MWRVILCLVLLGSLVGCKALGRELGANKVWEPCNQAGCSVCKGSGYFACSDCTAEGMTRCSTCNGTGMSDTGSQVICDTCQGNGYVYSRTGLQSRCPPCNATGRKTVYTKSQCPNCHGRGWAACGTCGGGKRLRHGRYVKVYADGQRVPGEWGRKR
jgi:DnaJ-class molecular chaperone